jgi:LPS export ABC transporter permease LptG/LPS export ABC transporter permease LptF
VFRTLDRYVIREILPSFFLSLLIFTFILDIAPTMDYLEALVAKGVTWSIAARIILTLVPQALGVTLPMALLVGLLIGLGRMSGDREAVALLACGVSPYRLLRPVLLIAAVVAAVHLYVMVRAIPDANQTYRQIVYDVVSQQVENDVRPQVFFTNFPNWVLYARDVPPAGGGWKDVMVAETRGPDAMTVMYMAARGRLLLDREKQTVTLVLEDGTRYSRRGDRAQSMETYRFPTSLMVQLDPKTVFSDSGKLLRGLAELTIPALQEQARQKLSNNITAHQELIFIQQKFSFPAACVVFGIIGIALGLSVARDGKLAGFVVGIAVIFVYYTLYYLADAVAKGFYAGPDGASRTLFVAQIARWVPNLILLPFGILALIWRARWAEGRIPFRSIVKLTSRAKGWLDTRRAVAATATSGSPAAALSGKRRRVVVVVRVPRMSWLMPTILDRYVAGIYIRAAVLAFAALLGLFYIGTFIDKTDKVFKGQASTGMVMQLLGFMTPQFVYFVIPLAALLGVLVTFGVLSRSSELAVMKACGISLYRIAAPLLVLSVGWSAILYGLEQRIMAQANEKAEALDSRIRGKQPRTSNPLSRQWVVGRDGAIYHYTYFDPQRNALQNLEVYRPAKDGWRLESQLFARDAVFKGDRWLATTGWQQDFGGKTAWTAFPERALTLEPPDYFETLQPIAEMMTVPQLKRYIDELSASGFNVVPLTIDLQKKLAFPFVTVVMTLLAIPFGMTAGKRGTLYGIGIGIVLALSYWILGGAFAAVGKAGILGPIMAGWAPNILAAGIAAYLLLRTRT